MGANSKEEAPFLRKAALDVDDFKLSNAERRQRVEDELCKLQERCKAAGLTPRQIQACARPFVECAKRKDRVRLLKSIFVCSLLVAAVSGIFANQTSSDWVITHLRLLSIHVIKPYWDFTVYYNDQCLINNPLFDESANRGELNCEICKELGNDVQSIEAKDVDPSVIFSDYLQENVPLVVHNAFDDWRALKELDTVDKLHELYMKDPILSTKDVCDVSGISSFKAAMKRLNNPKKIQSMSAVWQNCDKNAYKQFRKFYRRPAFLPGAAEAIHSNFVIVSMGKEKAQTSTALYNIFMRELMVRLSGILMMRLHPVGVMPSTEGDLAMWIGQVKGWLEYRLTPVRECAAQCQGDLVVVLKPGDYMLIPLDMWEVNFQPLGAQAEDAIAVGSGLVWDVSG